MPNLQGDSFLETIFKKLNSFSIQPAQPLGVESVETIANQLARRIAAEMRHPIDILHNYGNIPQPPWKRWLFRFMQEV